MTLYTGLKGVTVAEYHFNHIMVLDSHLKGDDARVVVVQSGEDVVGIGAEGG